MYDFAFGFEPSLKVGSHFCPFLVYIKISMYGVLTTRLAAQGKDRVAGTGACLFVNHGRWGVGFAPAILDFCGEVGKISLLVK
jgi:hypothetical protein